MEHMSYSLIFTSDDIILSKHKLNFQFSYIALFQKNFILLFFTFLLFSLDYNNFVLGNPTSAVTLGQCSSDVVKIASASSTGTNFFATPPNMCGTLTGNHCKLFLSHPVPASSLVIMPYKLQAIFFSAVLI